MPHSQAREARRKANEAREKARQEKRDRIRQEKLGRIRQGRPASTHDQSAAGSYGADVEVVEVVEAVETKTGVKAEIKVAQFRA